MASTPALLTAARAVLRRMTHSVESSARLLPQESRDLSDHVIIAGFGRVGQTLALLLDSVYVPYLAIDLDPELVSGARRRGAPVYFGDATRPDVLKAAGIERGQAAVITLDEPDSASRTVAVLRQLLPDLAILARARDLTQCERLSTTGATAVVPEIVEGSLQLGGALLRQLGELDEEVSEVLEQFRRATYSRLAATSPSSSHSGP
jgi:CPA2 family monovalent cation:H+ antiporter-2